MSLKTLNSIRNNLKTFDRFICKTAYKHDFTMKCYNAAANKLGSIIKPIYKEYKFEQTRLDVMRQYDKDKPLFNYNSICRITPAQIDVLNDEQFSSFADCYSWRLTPTQFASLQVNKLRLIGRHNFNYFRPEHWLALSNEQLDGIYYEQYWMMRYETLGVLEEIKNAERQNGKDETPYRLPEYLRFRMGQDGLKKELPTISPERIKDANFTSSFTPDIMDLLSPVQMKAFFESHYHGLNSEQFAKVPPEYYSLIADRAVAIKMDAFIALSDDRFSKLNPNYFSLEQQQSLTPARISVMSDWQISKWDPRRIITLTEGQKMSLTKHQINLLSPSQKMALFGGKIENLVEAIGLAGVDFYNLLRASVAERQQQTGI